MPSTSTDKGTSLHDRFLTFLYVFSLIAIAYFAADGFSYYTISFDKRPRSAEYGILKPSGTRGHAFGIIGSSMMIFMLLYSVRKRTKFFGKLGKLRNWLDVHIYFGIIGPLLIILHTSFKVQGLVMVSFWSMIAVASSGVFGRYLYLQIPRDVQGESLNLQDLNALKERMASQLKAEHSLSDDQIAAMERTLSVKGSGSGGILRSLWSILLDDVSRPIKLRWARKKYASEFAISPKALNRIFDIMVKKTLLERRMAFLDRVQQLFHYWHVFHKPFAIIMYIVMAVHVGVAIWLGYVWMF